MEYTYMEYNYTGGIEEIPEVDLKWHENSETSDL